MRRANRNVCLMACTAIVLCVGISLMLPVQSCAQKFVGNIIQNSVPSNFSTYWNQVTPENSGKWDACEPSRDNMNWGNLTTAYNYAKSNGMPFKQHTFVWGNQQPSWIGSLSQSEQRAEVEEWIRLFGQQFPNTDYIDVVNEPLHAPPSYAAALGGNGSTGWDWIVTAFQMARQYCPNAKLLINEYGIISDPGQASNYVNIINILKNRGLIDGIGIQCHAFNMDNVSTSTMNQVLNTLSATGLPIYVSELDIRGTDSQQLARYQEKFPVFWNNSNVKGITFWGYIQGTMWQEEAWLITASGTERAALTWIMDYIGGGSGGGNEHVWLEAECGTVGSLWNTPSDGNASNGEYVTIQSGNNSTGSAPTSATGQISFPFSVSESGTYKVWGRVITPTANDDSYWIRMDGGSWVMWNSIPAGSSWHWDDVHDSNNGSAVMTYNLSIGSHTLYVGYREDGTQLDKIYITNSGDTPVSMGGSANNCGSVNQPPVANAGSDQTVTDSDNSGSESVTLNGSGSSDSDGTITSYVWTEGGNQIATGVTPSVSLAVGTHNITLTVTDNDGATDTDGVTITVNAGSTGGDVHVWLEAECGTVGSLWTTPSDANASNDEYATIQSGNNSTSSAPSSSSGYITFPFSVASSDVYIVWGRVIAPNASDDSFWIRMDNGSWIMWNNIAQGSSWHWDEVHNANSGNQVVNYNLSSGSHTLTVAYREDGTQLDKIYITNTGVSPSGEGSAAENCGGSGGEGTVVVRARGNTGNEAIELRLNDNTVQTWNVSTSYQTFTYITSLTSANIKVYFSDAGGGSNDVQIDYIQVGGTTLQAEDQATNTGVWQNGGCGGSYAEWIHCAGYIDFGTRSISKAIPEDNYVYEARPMKFVLEQNYPNPFNPSTEIRYQLGDIGHVTLTVYDIMGHALRTLVCTEQQAGSYQVTWDTMSESGNRVPTGVYLYRIRVVTASEVFTSEKKMILMK
ncbi:endo-1,4-beta-xylanase [candidate division KSB1 bacterium]|nr:endo-1,4-beta-xylanase [candidate division KSB1 bacterium]